MALQEEQGSARFAYVDFHIIGTLNSQAASDRWEYYDVSYGAPTVFFDGQNPLTGSSSAYSRYEGSLASIGTESNIGVSAAATYDTSSERITVSVSIEAGEDIEFAEECVVRAVIAEDLQGAHTERKVARHLAFELPLAAAQEGQTQVVAKSFDSVPDWNTANMYVIAWVQRSSEEPSRNNAILNAVQSEFGDPTPVVSSSWGSVKNVFRAEEPVSP